MKMLHPSKPQTEPECVQKVGVFRKQLDEVMARHASEPLLRMFPVDIMQAAIAGVAVNIFEPRGSYNKSSVFAFWKAMLGMLN